MSHVVAIGVELGKVTGELESALGKAGFKPITQPAMSPILVEAASAATAKNQELDWFVALRNGDADLDLIYSFSDWSRAGTFKELVERIEATPSLKHVGILIYDLSDCEIVELLNQPLDDLVRVLTSTYQYGGPVGSAYHEFERR